MHLPPARLAAGLALALASVAAAAPAQAAPKTLEDYHYFRALSFDLVGRAPTRAELAAFEADGFDVDAWIDQQLSTPAYAERVRRVYLDLMRLTVGSSFQFVPGPVTLRKQTIQGPDGAPIDILFRQGQRRTDPLTDGEFCFPQALTGQAYPPFAVATGTAKNVSQADIDQRAVKVKPWWLYRDYAAKSPTQLFDPTNGFGAGTSLFRPANVLLFDQVPDPTDATKFVNGDPKTEIWVCKEEAQTGDLGTIYASGLTKKPDAIPAGRFSYPPVDSGYATMNAGQPVACTVAEGFKYTVDCGCGVGLERCNPAAKEQFDPTALNFPSRAPFGDATPFDATDQATSSWERYWWGLEAQHFLDYILEGDRDFREVLTASYGFVNGPLAQFYRRTAPSTCCGAGVNFGMTRPDPLFDPSQIPASIRPHDTDTWTKVDSRGPHASGLMTMPIFLTKFGSRRARAHVLYQAFLCRDFVAENVALTPSDEPDLTKRPGCNACHTALEPMAAYFSRIMESDWTYLPPDQFPAENPYCKGTPDPKTGVVKINGNCTNYYDPAFTTPDTAKLRGTYASPENAEAGPAALATVLTDPDTFPACVAQNVTSSFLGRPLGPSDDALKTALAKAFRDGGYKMSALVRALVKSDAYKKGNNLSADAWRAAEGGAP